MQDYLIESYGGLLENPLDNECYYCYTIYDTVNKKYYSGSRGNRGRSKHDLFDVYFTSSSVTDFTKRLRLFPNEFKFKIEYFHTRADAFAAETKFHTKHTVGNNQLFYNVISNGGKYVGSGTVICAHGDKIYRVSCEEYKTGKHKHIATGRMIVRLKNTGETISINKKEFDERIHQTQFKDYVMCIDKNTNVKRRIPKAEFDKSDNLVGITLNKISVIDLLTNTRTVIESDLFFANPDRYKGVTYGMVPVVDKQTGERKCISSKEFHDNKHKYKHVNDKKTVVYSISDRKNISIDKFEYHKNINNYLNFASTHFYEIDGHYFSNLKTLNQYYKETRNKTLPRIKSINLHLFDDSIKIINKQDHMEQRI